LKEGLWHFIGRIPKVFIGRYFRGQNGKSYGKLRKVFRVDPDVFPKKKRGKNSVRKKARKIISLTLPVTSLPMKSFPVTFGDATSGDVISGDTTSGDVTILLTILLKY
jgi:hypothetical protein